MDARSTGISLPAASASSSVTTAGDGTGSGDCPARSFAERNQIELVGAERRLAGALGGAARFEVSVQPADLHVLTAS